MTLIKKFKIYASNSIEQISEHIIITNHKFIGNFEKWLSIQHFQHPVILLNDGTTTNEDRLLNEAMKLQVINPLPRPDDPRL